jgi:hypothetical protein
LNLLLFMRLEQFLFICLGFSKTFLLFTAYNINAHFFKQQNIHYMQANGYA